MTMSSIHCAALSMNILAAESKMLSCSKYRTKILKPPVKVKLMITTMAIIITMSILISRRFNHLRFSLVFLTILSMQPDEPIMKKQNLVEKFADFAANNGMRRRNLMIMKSHSLLEQFLDGRIIYNLLDEQAWNEYINANDPTVLAAIRVFKTGAFPKRPAPTQQKR